VTSRQQEYPQPAASSERGARTVGSVPQGSGRGDTVGMASGERRGGRGRRGGKGPMDSIEALGRCM
jgi:hypothetical protein